MSLELHSFPLLISATSRMPLTWNHGPMYNVLLTSRYVRISELGIQWCTLCRSPALDMSRLPLLRDLTGMNGWHSSLPCIPTRDAFCRTTHTADKAVTLFPTERVDVALEQNVFADALHACHSQTANRNIATMNTDYQVSLCDIVDSKLDFVLDVTNGTVYWRQNHKPLWWSLCITVTSLFFFTRVCEHLALLVRGERRRFSPFTTAAIICVLLLCRVLEAAGVLTQHLVTQEELTLNLVLEVYCYVYIVAELVSSAKWYRLSNRLWNGLWGTSAVPYTILPEEEGGHISACAENSCAQDISVLGSLVAVQLILTAQLQNTFENPFLGILTLLFCTRTFLKFMNFALLHTKCERTRLSDWNVARKLFFLSVDTVTLACVFELAVRISARNDIEYASTATGMLVIIVLGGAFLHAVVVSWNRRKCVGTTDNAY
jgi:hypothetical protein